MEHGYILVKLIPVQVYAKTARKQNQPHQCLIRCFDLEGEAGQNLLNSTLPLQLHAEFGAKLLCEMDLANKKCRIGFVACASITRKNYHGVLAASGVEFAGFASRSLQKCQQWSDALGVPASTKRYGSYDELISDPSVDALYIPLPTSLHEEIVMRAIAAKKAILIEKPAALSTESLERMLRAAMAAGVPMWDGVMFMHHARLASMKSDLSSPSFGRVLKVVSGFSFAGDAAFNEGNIRVKKDLDTLGSLGDLGWYSIRFALWAMDWELPAYVTGTCLGRSSEGVPTDVIAQLVWQDGRSAHFDCSFHTAFRQYCEVGGERGSLKLDDFVISRTHASVEYSVVTNPGLDDTHSNVLGEKSVKEIRGCNQEAQMWTAFGREVVACKYGGQAVHPYHPKAALLTQAVTDAVYASCQAEGKQVKVAVPSMVQAGEL